MQAKTSLKANKPINKKGRVTLEYEVWRDSVAKPYLDTKFGHKCACGGCTAVEGLEVDHIINRTNQNRQLLSNVQYLCAYPCHYNKTNKIKCRH